MRVCSDRERGTEIVYVCVCVLCVRDSVFMCDSCLQGAARQRNANSNKERLCVWIQTETMAVTKKATETDTETETER